ncbi:class I glutamine amidotransferase-like protein [Aaosphaeria arxii CBS 175.79]|uniref:Class I glutamine amidotransferase-like protein n=1 Tax=Aaosphaeria arxii CBS 175.79 TaxID=1450172 RepID=A0A6A5X9U6_9PLEO|nr:class I glutamine amidotransferase-like protein [Aaosphaeria arxii CBS 175.79]KAF2009732.1 class I glutamine amidotransferase-like protein [Aaosphaeria arxii CBS 175.79]
MASSPKFNVAVLLYPGADILDYSGPLEILTTTPPPGHPRSFTTTTFAPESPVRVAEKALTIIPDLLLDDLAAHLDNYDILIVPGASGETLETFLGSEQGRKAVEVVRRFSRLAPRGETGKRVLESVCSGALILAAGGVLAGRRATTHHAFFEELEKVADGAEGQGGKSGIEVLRGRRWVDAGVTEEGVRIVTAGGVSSGIDATLWVVEELVGKEAAEWTAEIVEFERRGEGEGWGA